MRNPFEYRHEYHGTNLQCDYCACTDTDGYVRSWRGEYKGKALIVHEIHVDDVLDLVHIWSVDGGGQDYFRHGMHRMVGDTHRLCSHCEIGIGIGLIDVGQA